jgi:uncharacterized protein (TIRG00374 family)
VEVLRRIGLTPFLIYLAVNCGIALLFANRWWLLLRGLGVYLPFGRVAVYRMIAATVSLLTPGPQFGGEPAQVYLLVRRAGVSAPQAVASVALDRLLELTLNLTFLVSGILYTLWSGLLGAGLNGRVILFALLPLALPPLLLFSLWWRGHSIASAAATFMHRLPDRWQGRPLIRLVAALADGEAHIHMILRDNPRIIAAGALVSVGNWVVLLADFWLATWLIGLELNATQFVGFVVAAHIAILLPIPAGLGALEASQILAAHQFGLNPALGLALVLLFRVRDVALALWGLGLAWRERSKEGRTVIRRLGSPGKGTKSTIQ